MCYQAQTEYTDSYLHYERHHPSMLLVLTFLKSHPSISLAVFYFVDITVTATVKKNESEITAWVSVAPPTEQIFVTWVNYLVVFFSAHAGFPKQPGELPAGATNSCIQLLYPCNINAQLQPDHSCNGNSSAKPYKPNYIGSFTKQQHN